MTEAQLQAAVVELAELLRWRVCHFHDSRRDIGGGRQVGDRLSAGWPDLVLCRDGHIVFAELKAQDGRLKQPQREWLDQLGAVSVGCDRVQVFLWRPAHWAAGHIEAVLRTTGQPGRARDGQGRARRSAPA